LHVTVEGQSLSSLESLVIDDASANGPDLDNNDEFGTSVVSLGDLNGDGVFDIAVGSEKDDAGGKDRGMVHIHFLSADGSVDSSMIIDYSTLNGPSLANGDRYGASLANMGDLNGDGVIDLAVGAYKDDGGGDKQGTVHLHFLNANGSVKETIEINSNLSNGPFLGDNDEYGISIANMGDLDGNGYNDMAVGSRKNDTGGSDRGAVHIHFLDEEDGDIVLLNTVKFSSDTNDGAALSDNDQYGVSVANIGDLDGDGIDELAVGADKRDTGGTDRGSIFIHFLDIVGVNATITSTTSIAHGTSNGPSILDKASYGSAISLIGDMNSDGVDDIAVGAFNDSQEGENWGAVYIHFMNTNATVDSTWKVNNTTTGDTLMSSPHDRFGKSLALLGDMNNDGVVEFLVGEPGDSEEGTKRGAVHIISLNGSIVVVTEVVWNGAFWSGGASTLVLGGPSNEIEDVTKSMTIEAGDTARITEEIVLASLQVDSNAILEVAASQCMTILGAVNVHDSAIVILTATSDSTYAQYHGAAMANTTVEMMLEHYDWHQIASPVAGATLADLKAENSVGGDGYIVYASDHTIDLGDSSQIRWYETQDYNGGTNIGYGADSSYSDAFGTWYGGKSTDTFDGRNGFMIFVNATLTQDTPLPLKLKITGTTNDTTRSTSTDIDNYGWTMVSNPYPCAVDWETIEARIGTATNGNSFDFLPTVSIWDPANQNYATYLADGAGTSGIAANNNGTGVSLSSGARYIAPFQSFWVQRSDYVGEDDGSTDAKIFKMLPTDRVKCEKPKHFKKAAPNYAVMRVELSSDDNHYSDELLLRFSEQYYDTYSGSKDAHKLSSPNEEVALISTRIGGKSLVVHSRSLPDENTIIPLWTKAQPGANLKIKVKDIPSEWSAWIVEVSTGNTFEVTDGSFEFVNFDRGNSQRFNLVVKEGFEKPEFVKANIFTHDNRVEVVFDYPGVKKKVIVKDLLGRVIHSVDVVDEELMSFNFDKLAKQAYVIQVISQVNSKMYKVIL